jgi:hypothetical protein
MPGRPTRRAARLADPVPSGLATGSQTCTINFALEAPRRVSARRIPPPRVCHNIKHNVANQLSTGNVGLCRRPTKPCKHGSPR